MGRSAGNMLLAEDAQIMRNAVWAATRYLGIRLQDLERGGTWVTAAMRKSSPMSVKTAERLFRAVHPPDEALVKGKSPQGMPMDEAWAAIERNRETPEGSPLPSDPAFEYIGYMLEAQRIVNSYAHALPGSTIFVIPGTACSNATALVDSVIKDLPTGAVSEKLKRGLVKHSADFFELAERPLARPDRKALLQQLYVVGLSNRFELLNEIDKAFPEEKVFDGLMPAINAWTAAQRRRSEQCEPKKLAARKKRRVAMPRIRDSLK
jgi:hypothetical protein